MVEPFEGNAYSLGHNNGNALCQSDADSYGGMRRTVEAIHERAMTEIGVLRKYSHISFSPAQQSQYIAGFTKGYTERRDYIDNYKLHNHYPEIWDT